MIVPFTRTTLGEEEKKAMADVIDSGWVVMGPKTQEFEEQFAEYVGSDYAIFVDSGTAALFLSLKYLDIKGEIAVPSLTFASTAEVIVNSGAIPHFYDVDLKTFNLEFAPIVAIPVHLMGRKSGLDALMYDSAHRIEKDDLKEDDGALWCYSFYATKNLTTINGGMIATNNKNAAEWLKKARDHGISKGTTERYKEGKWEYSVDFVGLRFKADDVRAAIGLEQLKKLPENTQKRNDIVKRYNSLLGLNRVGNHIFPLLVQKRSKFIEFLRSRGIQASVHFLPVHKMSAYSDYAVGVSLPNTDFLGDRLVSLPLYPQMTEAEIDYVVKTVKDSNLMIQE